MVKKKNTKSKIEMINETEWLKGLPVIPRMFVGMIQYNLKEILFILAIIFLGLWLLTSFGYTGEKIQIRPGVKIDINKKLGMNE